MTPDQAEEALKNNRPRPRRAASLTAEERRLRNLARARAQSDARQALVRLHRDEYQALYDVAIVGRMAEIEQQP